MEVDTATSKSGDKASGKSKKSKSKNAPLKELEIDPQKVEKDRGSLRSPSVNYYATSPSGRKVQMDVHGKGNGRENMQDDDEDDNKPLRNTKTHSAPRTPGADIPLVQKAAILQQSRLRLQNQEYQTYTSINSPDMSPGGHIHGTLLSPSRYVTNLNYQVPKNYGPASPSFSVRYGAPDVAEEPRGIDPSLLDQDTLHFIGLSVALGIEYAQSRGIIIGCKHCASRQHRGSDSEDDSGSDNEQISPSSKSRSYKASKSSKSKTTKRDSYGDINSPVFGTSQARGRAKDRKSFHPLQKEVANDGATDRDSTPESTSQGKQSYYGISTKNSTLTGDSSRSTSPTSPKAPNLTKLTISHSEEPAKDSQAWAQPPALPNAQTKVDSSEALLSPRTKRRRELELSQELLAAQQESNPKPNLVPVVKPKREAPAVLSNLARQASVKRGSDVEKRVSIQSEATRKEPLEATVSGFQRPSAVVRRASFNSKGEGQGSQTNLNEIKESNTDLVSASGPPAEVHAGTAPGTPSSTSESKAYGGVKLKPAPPPPTGFSPSMNSPHMVELTRNSSIKRQGSSKVAPASARNAALNGTPQSRSVSPEKKLE
jgi:hypothetical protein